MYMHACMHANNIHAYTHTHTYIWSGPYLHKDIVVHGWTTKNGSDLLTKKHWHPLTHCEDRQGDETSSLCILVEGCAVASPLDASQVLQMAARSSKPVGHAVDVWDMYLPYRVTA